MHVYLHTLGCKVNSIETDSMAALLRGAGYTIADAPEGADVIVLNSCTVTASGDSRMHKALRRLRSAAPEAVLVLTGCFVQAFPAQAAALPEADILLGTQHRAALPALLRQYFDHGERISSVGELSPAFEALPVGESAAHTRAFLKVQDGCDRFCSYCIIPYARGRSRSLPFAEVRSALRAQREAGYLEVVICGINLACYRGENGEDLADLAAAASEVGFPRVRLGSLEPDGMTEDVLHRLASVPGLCPQFHIAVQSGCDRTLAAMRRHYTTAEFTQLVQNIRSIFPGAAITTDIMVGFPGETEDDHAETMQFVRETGFAQMHVFRYSPRPGTTAAERTDQIPEAVKKRRADALGALAGELHAAYLRGCVGQRLAVLFERERGSGFHTGHAGNYAAVLVPNPDSADWRNTIREVSITGTDGQRLFGEI